MLLSRKILWIVFNPRYFHDRFGRTCQLKNDTALEDYKIFYIGKESLALTNLMMSYNKNMVISHYFFFSVLYWTCPSCVVGKNKGLNISFFLIK